MPPRPPIWLIMPLPCFFIISLYSAPPIWLPIIPPLLIRLPIIPPPIMPAPPASFFLTSFFSFGTRLATYTFSQSPDFKNGRGSTRVSGLTVSGVSSSSSTSGRLSRTLRFSSDETSSHFDHDPSGCKVFRCKSIWE